MNSLSSPQPVLNWAKWIQNNNLYAKSLRFGWAKSILGDGNKSKSATKSKQKERIELEVEK